MEERRAALVQANLPLVEQVVLRVSGGFPRFVDRSELVGAGTLGLVEAALRYDFDRGIPFAGYAIQRIRGAVLDVARSADWAPRSLRRMARDAEHATNELAVEHRGAPSDDQVAERIGVAPAELRRMREEINLGVTRALDSRERLDRRDDDDQLVDRTVPEPDELLEGAEMNGYLRAALDSLPERLRLIIVGLYLENRSFEELAELLGVTTSRISQLRADAIEMIRHGIDSQFEPTDTAKPKGRVAIRQARYAADIARHSDMRTRLSRGEHPMGVAARRRHDEPSMPVAEVPDSPEQWSDEELEPTAAPAPAPSISLSA
jgi:RNA polymerase sigma factor for flagellar operon FliA